MRLLRSPELKDEGVVARLIEQRGLAHLPNIEWSPIGALRPNSRNPPTHSRKQIKQIAASIKKLGFLNPVPSINIG
jgi:hypothetical protein